MKKTSLRILASVLGAVVLLISPEVMAYVSVVGVDLNAGGGNSNSQEIQMTIPAGLQIFALPAKTINPITARWLRDAVNSSGGSLTLITRLSDKGVFEPYMEGLTPDFNILPDRGYLINNARACTIKLQVEKVASAIPVNIRKGMNIISTPTGGPYAASSLLTALQAAGLGSQYIVGMNGGNFQLYYPFLATPDFPIEIGKGYILASKKASVWTPSALRSKAAGSSATSKASRSLELEQAIASQVVNSSKEANRAPILLAVRPTVVRENYTSKLIGLDLDGDDITYSAKPNSKGFILNSTTGEYTWNVNLAPYGTYDIVFSATDGVNAAVQQGRFIVQK